MKEQEIEIIVKAKCMMAPKWTKGHLAMTLAGCTITNPESEELVGYLEADAIRGNPIIKVVTEYGPEGNRFETWTITPQDLFAAFLEARGDLNVPIPQPEEDE